jgi:phage terminase small subunit
MPRERLPTAGKKLRGTYRASRDVPENAGRVRLSAAVGPPDDLDKSARPQWVLHMELCIRAGTLAVTDLAAFRLLVESAALTARGYAAALKAGPVARSDRGSKVSPEWQAWVAANARYTALLDRFGLTPASGRTLPLLPPARGQPLREVA